VPVILIAKAVEFVTMYNIPMYILFLLYSYLHSSYSVSDHDPHGSAFNWSPGSGSTFGMRIRIQEG
jgi:hypothetical protein